MAHLVIFELGALGGGLMRQAKADGHVVTFVTGNLDFYLKNCSLSESPLDLADDIYVVTPYSYEALSSTVSRIAGVKKIDALICTVTYRIPDAAKIAAEIGTPYLNCRSANLLRDKYLTRIELNTAGVRQPQFSLVSNPEQLEQAAAQIGMPVVVKPVDGFASINAKVLESQSDLQEFVRAGMPSSTFGQGVVGNGKYIVEKFLEGKVISCETMSFKGEHLLLGITDRIPTPRNSTVELGGVFGRGVEDEQAIWTEAKAILQAVGFDHGASHVEFVMTADGPVMIDLNPRLIGGPMPLLIAAALGRPIYRDLIDLHRGMPVVLSSHKQSSKFACIRWVTATRIGTLRDLVLPDCAASLVFDCGTLKRSGNLVRPPEANGDRLAFVVTCDDDRRSAEAAADHFVQQTRVVIEEPSDALV
jgi:predicted ATP-grasp superfamily ATP-dependent carboligase